MQDILLCAGKKPTSYMMQNRYIDTSIQKGGIPDFSGYLEHTSMISQLIREAKQKKGDLTVVWLELANTYRSIPHTLIHEGLDHYYSLAAIQSMISSYLGRFKLRFTSGQFTTNCQDLQKGIPTGCTISPILFIMGMNLLIMAAEGVNYGSTLESGICQPVIRGFMDDITVTTASHVQARRVLETLGTAAMWSRITFKVKKSRSLVIRRGKVTGSFSLQVQGDVIPPTENNPVKCLGKWIDASLTEWPTSTMLLCRSTNLVSLAKTWLYQHGLLPMVLWLFTVYEFPMTVEGFERKINKHLQRGLGIPPSFSSVNLCIRSGQL